MADQSLRKGTSTIYFQYAITGHKMGAVDTRVAVVNGVALLKFKVQPITDSQRLDENYLHGHALLCVHISDKYVLKGLRRFLAGQSTEISNGMRLEIYSRNKTLSFPVKQAQYRRESLLEITL
ncbi:MAG TPA: hypothetical protein VGK22_03765 [Candidatus Angelobacter sp.]|jgi:hypothetical protein